MRRRVKGRWCPPGRHRVCGPYRCWCATTVSHARPFAGSCTRSEGDEFDRPNGGLAGRADPAILAPMPKLRPAIRYGIDALLILIPLLGMTYFLFDPEAFNAFLAWLARIL